MNAMLARAGARLVPALGALAVLGFWALAYRLRFVDPTLLPSPTETLSAFVEGIGKGALRADVLRTVERTLIAFVIGAAIAVPLGVVLGASAKVYRSVEFLVDFFRSTPASVLFPLFLVLFGTGERTKIAAAVFGAALVMVFNVAYGVMNARKQRLLAAKVLGASKARILFDVTARESLPQIFVGLRSGVSLVLVIVIVAEMFMGSTDGLGYRVINAQMIFDMPMMYAAIITAGTLGYGLNLLFGSIERRWVHWAGR